MSLHHGQSTALTRSPRARLRALVVEPCASALPPELKASGPDFGGNRILDERLGLEPDRETQTLYHTLLGQT